MSPDAYGSTNTFTTDDISPDAYGSTNTFTTDAQIDDVGDTVTFTTWAEKYISGSGQRVSLSGQRGELAMVEPISGGGPATVSLSGGSADVDRVMLLTGDGQRLSVGGAGGVLRRDVSATGSGQTVALSGGKGELSLAPWQIDGREIDLDASTLTLTPLTLSVEFLVPESNLDHWRQYDRAGDLREIDGSAGIVRTESARDVDPVVVNPFDGWRPPFDRNEFHISGYNEEQISPDEVRLSMDLQRTANRFYRFSGVSQTGDWEFSFINGTVGVSGDYVSMVDIDGEEPGQVIGATLLLSGDQAKTVVDSAGYPDAIAEREVDDGDNYLVDTSDDNRQTVSVTSPSGLVDNADYFVGGWTLEYRGTDNQPWRMEIPLLHDTS